MITALLAGALAIGAAQQQLQLDTTFTVRAGGELRVEAMNGTVAIDTWDRDAMRVRARHGGGVAIELDRSGSGVSIETRHRGMPRAVAYEITVPRTYDVDVEGLNLEIRVAGIRGSAMLENVQGSITASRITGDVDVESVSGAIALDNVTGDITVATVNQAIRIDGSRGAIEAETANGSIVMRGVESGSVDASTVNGIVEYHGTIRDGGSYFLGTHNGRITISIPEQTNARIGIETFNGRVESAFPMRVRDGDDREFSFTIGSGSARVELESFNGTINLVRPRGR